MALVEIDVIGPQPLQRCIQLFVHLGPRQAPVGFGHGKEEFGREHIRGTGNTGKRFAQQSFGCAPAIDVRRIEKGDAQIERRPDAADGPRLLNPTPIGEPRAKRDLRYRQVAGAELSIMHTSLLGVARTPLPFALTHGLTD